MQKKMKEFLAAGHRGIDLKYIFDHLRNVGIGAVVIYAGLTLTKNSNDKSLNVLGIEPGIVGVVIVVFGAVLLLFNFMQLLLLSNPSGDRLRLTLPAAISAPVYVLTIYLVVAYIKMRP